MPAAAMPARLIHLRQVGRGHPRIRRQPVHLGLVEQQEDRAGAADAVAVRWRRRAAPRSAPARAARPPAPWPSSTMSSWSPNLMDVVGQALAQAGVSSSTKPVVAQRALLGDADVGDGGLLAVRSLPLVVTAAVPSLRRSIDAERAARHAGAAAVADVVLHHHGAELGAEQRPGRAHVEAPGVRAVLAHVGGHQPAEFWRVRRRRIRGRQVLPRRRTLPRRRADARACRGRPARGRTPAPRRCARWPCSMKATCRQVLAPSAPVLS